MIRKLVNSFRKYTIVKLIRNMVSMPVQVLRGQIGMVLPLAIIASLLGIAVVVPTAVLVGTAALRQGDFEDKTRESYLTDAAIIAVIEDLIRGADANPGPPTDYLPPTVNFADQVPNITVRGLDDLDSPQLSVRLRTIPYDAVGNLTVTAGVNPLGGVTDIALDDEFVYRLTAVGNLPDPRVPSSLTGLQTLTYEITSENIGIPDVNFAEVRIKVNAWEESSKVELFVFNDNPDFNPNYESTNDPWVPYTKNTRLMDHEHLQNHSLHNHDANNVAQEERHDHHNDNKNAPAHTHHIGQDHHHHAHTSGPDAVPDHDHHHHEFEKGHSHGHHHGNQDDGSHHTDLDIGSHEQDDNAHHHHEGDHLHLHDPVHPHGHDHESHNHKPHDHHNGETTLTLFLKDNELKFLNALPLATATPPPLKPKSLKIRVTATVYHDPLHHHHVHNRNDNNKEGSNVVHDHHHQWHHKTRRDFTFDTDNVKFLITGDVTVEQLAIQTEPAPKINSGTAGTFKVKDTRVDDVGSFSIASTAGALDFEVTSDEFRFKRFDTLAIPMVFRTSKSAVKVRMFVFNPAHGPGGYSGTPDLEIITSVANVDRAVTLKIPKDDFTYLNSLTPITAQIKITASGGDFSFDLDSLHFIATTSDAQSQPVRASTFQLSDPGTKDPAMATMGPGKGFVLQIANLHPGVFSANWALETALSSPRFYSSSPDHDDNDGVSIRVFQGQVIGSQGNVLAPGGISEQPTNVGNDNNLIAQANAHHGSAFLTTGLFDVETGLYSIVYFNNTDAADGFTAKTKPFNPSGDNEDTWIYGSAY